MISTKKTRCGGRVKRKGKQQPKEKKKHGRQTRKSSKVLIQKETVCVQSAGHMCIRFAIRLHSSGRHVHSSGTHEKSSELRKGVYIR